MDDLINKECEDQIIEEFIIYDGDNSDVSSDKYKRRHPKVTDQQMTKMSAFMNDNEGVDTSSVIWNNLTAELNELGPPKLTSKQWSKAWSNFKYNKRKCLGVSASNQGSVNSVASVKLKNLDSFAQEEGNVLETLNTVIRNQNLLLKQQKEMIDNNRKLSEKVDRVLEKM